METVAGSAEQRRTTSFDLAVIGAGPAGTSAAITAARSGARVLLVERGKLPRQRVCGEFVSAESLGLLAGLLDGSGTALLPRTLRIAEARLFLDGRVISTPVEPAAASIARFDLDAALWHAAEAAGVTALGQTMIENISGNGPFHLATSIGEFHARALINAGGRWSNLRKSSPDTASAKDGAAKWLGLKAHFFEPSPHGSVDLYFFDGGYCGVQPVMLAGSNADKERVNVCAMVRSDVARSLPEVFEQHAHLKDRAQNWQALMEPVTTSPLVFREPEPVEDAILMAGDAAGFVDPFVGDGISLALRSGALAAECLAPFLRERISLSEAASQYGKAYRQRLLPVFRNSSRIRQLLNLPRPIRKAVGQLLEATPAVSRLLVHLTR